MSTLYEAAAFERLVEALDKAARERTSCPHRCGNPDTRIFGCFCELPAKPEPIYARMPAVDRGGLL